MTSTVCLIAVRFAKIVEFCLLICFYSMTNLISREIPITLGKWVPIQNSCHVSWEIVFAKRRRMVKLFEKFSNFSYAQKCKLFLKQVHFLAWSKSICCLPGYEHLYGESLMWVFWCLRKATRPNLVPPQRSQLYNGGVGGSSFLLVDPTGNSSGSKRFNSFSVRIEGDKTESEKSKIKSSKIVYFCVFITISKQFYDK